MRYRRFAFVLVTLCLLAVSRAAAQSELSLDLTATRVAYDGFLASNAVTVAPAFSSSGARGTALASLIATFFESGSTSAVMAFDGAGRLTKGRRAALDLRASAGMSFYQGIPAVDLIVGPRVTGFWPSAAMWAGVEAGGLAGRSSEGGATRLSFGSWWRRGRGTFRASVQPTWINAGAFGDVVLDVAMRTTDGRLRFGLAAGQRLTTTDSITGNFAAATTHLRLARTVELALAGGRSLPDLLRRTPGARYASLGLRVATGLNRAATERPAGVGPSTGALALISSRSNGDSLVLVVRALDAATVEITGDFTDWEPRALSRVSGSGWRAAFALTPGVYRYNVRVNGGEWSVPAGAASVRDDFGGDVAVVVVQSPRS